MENIKQKMLEEVEAFVIRSGEDIKAFTAKVQVFNGVVTKDFSTGETKEENELVVTLLAPTPEGVKAVYSNVVGFKDSDTEEEVFDKIVKAFPTKEEIEEAKKQREEEIKAREKIQQEMMSKLNSEEIAKMMQEEQPVSEDTETKEPTPSTDKDSGEPV